LIVTVLLGAQALIADSALAADVPPSANECILVYRAAGKERARFEDSRNDRLMGHSIVEFVPNALAVGADDYSSRANKLQEDSKAESVASVEEAVPTWLLETDQAHRPNVVMGREAITEEITTYLQPEKVYEIGRSVFELVHTCDQKYGYMPVIGPPPAPDKIEAIIRQRFKPATDQSSPLAAQYDISCAAVFMLLPKLNENDRSLIDASEGRLQISMLNVFIFNPGISRERLVEAVRKDAADRERLLVSSSDVDTLHTEINGCERHYSMILTPRQQP
jgi:hypothetical protein